MKVKKDESGIGVPTISRSKKKDSPKGGKISPALIGVAAMVGPSMLSQGQAATQREEQERQARLAKQKASILRGK